MRIATKKLVAAVALTLCTGLAVTLPAEADTVDQAGLKGWCC